MIVVVGTTVVLVVSFHLYNENTHTYKMFSISPFVHVVEYCWSVEKKKERKEMIQVRR
jgi:hypothetical protein